MCLIIVKSFIELTKTLLGEDGVKYILNEKFSQDSLKEEFAKHRRIGETCENPTLSQIQKQEVALHATDSNLITGLTVNTADRETDREPRSIDSYHLPRRKANKN